MPSLLSLSSSVIGAQCSCVQQQEEGISGGAADAQSPSRLTTGDVRRTDMNSASPEATMADIEASGRHDPRSLTGEERVVKFLKYVKPTLLKPDTLYCDLFVAALMYSGSEEAGVDEENKEVAADLPSEQWLQQEIHDLSKSFYTRILEEHYGKGTPSLVGHIDQTVESLQTGILDIFQSENFYPGEKAFMLAMAFEKALNKIVPEDMLITVKSDLSARFSPSEIIEIAVGVRPDESAKQLNNSMIYACGSIAKKMLLPIGALATQTLSVYPGNVNSATILSKNHPVWGALSAFFILLQSAEQVRLTWPGTSGEPTVQEGPDAHPESSKDRVGKRIQLIASEMTQEKRLLHMAGWAQAVNGLDHFLRYGVKEPLVALVSAFIYSGLMSVAEAPNAVHAGREYKIALEKQTNSKKLFAQYKQFLGKPGPENMLSLSVKRELEEDRDRDVSSAKWTFYTNLVFAISMVSVFAGLIAGRIIPTERADEDSKLAYDAKYVPIIYAFVATFWFPGMVAHAIPMTIVRLYDNYPKYRAK